MIWDFPSLRWKSVDDTDSTEHYTRHVTVITRKPWIRIIWGPTQKTIIIGHCRINFTRESEEVYDE